MTTWTEEMDKFVLENRGKMSSSLIAAHLTTIYSPVTRNSVLGRVNRLKDILEIQSLRRTNPPQSKPRAARTYKGMPRRKRQVPRLHTIESAPLPRDAVLGEPLMLSLLDLQPHHCRYPVTDDLPFLFCGNIQIDGCSYCAGHALVAFNVPERRRAAA